MKQTSSEARAATERPTPAGTFDPERLRRAAAPAVAGRSYPLADEQVRLAAQVDDAERLIGLGWAEWNLVTDEVLWSRRVFDLFGLDPTGPPLRLNQVPAHIHSDDLPAVSAAFDELVGGRTPVTVQFRTAGPEAEQRYVGLAIEPVIDAVGGLVGMRGVVQDITTRCRMEAALARSRRDLRRQRERSIEEMQRALLPRAPERLPGLRAAVRYLPADDGIHVGGDWYEVAPLPDGKVLVAIGDASGHGLAAAARMAQLRNALLGIAHTDAGPARILECLNRVAFHNQASAAIASAVVAHFDPDARTLTWGRAGHPPPVLIRSGLATELRSGDGTMLGATEHPGYHQTAVALRPGDRVLLYTDGLVEKRADPAGDRERLLLAAAARCTGRRPEDDVSWLLAALDDSADPEDDTCLVVLHVT